MSAITSQSILIVEDDRKTTELLSVYLQREGFQTFAAYGGQQALALAVQHRPALAVLDVMLPDGTGDRRLVDGEPACEQDGWHGHGPDPGVASGDAAG